MPLTCEYTQERNHFLAKYMDHFFQNSYLKSHMRIHTGETPNTYNKCGSAFSWCDQLKIHMRIRIGEKLFSCKVCGSVFSHRSILKSHMKIHTGNKPFSCEVCEFSHI